MVRCRGSIDTSGATLTKVPGARDDKSARCVDAAHTKSSTLPGGVVKEDRRRDRVEVVPQPLDPHPGVHLQDVLNELPAGAARSFGAYEAVWPSCACLPADLIALPLNLAFRQEDHEGDGEVLRNGLARQGPKKKVQRRRNFVTGRSPRAISETVRPKRRCASPSTLTSLSSAIAAICNPAACASRNPCTGLPRPTPVAPSAPISASEAAEGGGVGSEPTRHAALEARRELWGLVARVYAHNTRPSSSVVRVRGRTRHKCLALARLGSRALARTSARAPQSPKMRRHLRRGASLRAHMRYFGSGGVVAHVQAFCASGERVKG